MFRFTLDRATNQKHRVAHRGKMPLPAAIATPPSSVSVNSQCVNLLLRGGSSGLTMASAYAECSGQTLTHGLFGIATHAVFAPQSTTAFALSQPITNIDKANKRQCCSSGVLDDREHEGSDSAKTTGLVTGKMSWPPCGILAGDYSYTHRAPV